MNEKALARQTGSLETILQNNRAEIMRVADGVVDVDRLIGLALEMSKRPDLSKCSQESVIRFCKKCSEWGTSRIGAGGVWPVAYGNELTPIPDWRFLVQKAKDAGAILHATCEEVYSKDKFSYQRGLNPDLQHQPVMGDRGSFVACYCVYTLPTGVKDFAVMSAEEIEHVRSLAPSKNSPAWKNYPGEMRKKTCIRRTMKLFEAASPKLASILKEDAMQDGYIDAEAIVREDIPMPTPIENSTGNQANEETPPAKPKSKPAAKNEPDQDEPPSDDGEANNTEELSVTGVPEKVSTKSGEGKKGPWTKYGVLLNGTWYGTFDTTIGQDAQEAAANKEEVRIVYEEEGKYCNIVSMEIIDDIPA